jgi:hypothetical protein
MEQVFPVHWNQLLLVQDRVNALPLIGEQMQLLFCRSAKNNYQTEVNYHINVFSHFDQKANTPVVGEFHFQPLLPLNLRYNLPVYLMPKQPFVEYLEPVEFVHQTMFVFFKFKYYLHYLIKEVSKVALLQHCSSLQYFVDEWLLPQQLAQTLLDFSDTLQNVVKPTCLMCFIN